ncbi:hypothetical protein [Parablautia intestinalis]|jgi:hypothetical protein|uniref:hypothetical protein n=1 Tax=Parablautia intestinalis TaxID=2320100 RepID=UPI0024124569|nr:hypothetical protein [Parablautia intestinalis]
MIINMKKSRTTIGSLLRALLLPCIVIAVLLFFAAALNSLEAGRESEEMAQLEDVLRRSCVACYAAEGTYPSDLEYLKEHYGVHVDEEKYTVYYNLFAQNLMPDITVLENKVQK